jgi:hypothetical protein
VSESGRDGSATAIVSAVELLALSKANAPEISATTAIKIAMIFISIPLLDIPVWRRVLSKVMIRRSGGTIWQKSPPRPCAEFASHEAYRFPQNHEFPKILRRDRNLHKFIIITIIVPSAHDAVIRRENV